MKDLFRPEQRRDLARRGFTRRDFGRLAALMTAGAARCRSTTRRRWPRGSRPSRTAARRGPDQRQREPDGPLPRGGRGDPQGRPAGRPLPLRARPSPSSARWPRSRAVARARPAVRRLERPAAPGRAGLHRAASKSFVVADPGYEAGERAAQFVGARTVKVPLRKDCVARRPGHGPGRPRRRPHLRLQPQQPDRLGHPQGRHRVPRRQQAQGGGRPARRGVHPPLEDGRAGLAAGRGRQGRDHPPDVLEALRHGRPPRRRGAGAARPAREDPRATAPGPCRPPAWSAPSPASRSRAWSSRGGRSSPTSARRRSGGSRRRATPSSPPKRT